MLRFFFLLFVLALFLNSCSQNERIRNKGNFELQLKNPASKNYTPPYIFFETERISLQTRISLDNDKRNNIVEYALKFNGKNKLKKNKKFRNDCSGFVRAVYDKFGINLFDTDNLKSGGKWYSGTRVIYNFIKENGEIFKDKIPRKGDLIFFDNTNDRNKDGKVNDYFTHVAIVIKVDENQTVYYIHKSSRGINIQKLNLKYKNRLYISKNGKKIKVNSFLRRKRKRDPKNTPYLSSQMFRAFGTLFNEERVISKNR